MPVNSRPQRGNTVNPRPQRFHTVSSRPQRCNTVNPRPQRGNTVNPRPQRGHTVNPCPQRGHTVNTRPQGFHTLSTNGSPIGSLRRILNHAVWVMCRDNSVPTSRRIPQLFQKASPRSVLFRLGFSSRHRAQIGSKISRKVSECGL